MAPEDTKALRILNLEDRPRDTKLIHATLTEGGVACDILRVRTRVDFVVALESGDVDLVLADYSLPSFDGLSALKIARDIRPELPFVLVSGTLGEDRAIEALTSGATDYVLKHRLERLVPAVRRAVEEAKARAERKRAEEALKESEERFRLTFELAPVGMAHVSPDGRWLMINDKLLEIIGYSREELLELTFQDITPPEDVDADLHHARQLLAGRIPTYSTEKRYIRKDRSRVWICLTSSLVRSSSGEPEYFISIIEDITERKLAELIPDPLTPRELEVLDLVAQRKTNPEIAGNLPYSLATVKLDIRHIIAKLEASDRHEAAERAVDIGLISPG